MNPQELTRMMTPADPTSELPPEMQEMLDELEATKNAKIEEIGKQVAKLRDEAVKGRRQSGAERIWEADEEFYEGVDDANRDNHPWTKSASTQGGINRTPAKSSTRCTAFFNITRQFVDSASARMGDILLPAGDWNFAVKASPVQDPAVVQGGSAPVPGSLPGLGGPAPTVQTEQEQDQDPRQKEAEAKAARGEVWIQDALVECSYHTEVRKTIEDGARIGTGILKGPFPEKKTGRKVTTLQGRTTLEIVEKINPASKSVDPWNFFPDPACGESIHNGAYTCERDYLTAKKLRDLKGTPGYLADQIDKVLEEGPCKKNYTDGFRNSEKTNEEDLFEVWYFYGQVDPVYLSAMNVNLTEAESARPKIPAIVTLVNETAIKAVVDPMDTGEFPYDVMPWQRVAGCWWGIGVARQGRTAQEMLNASARALMDNAGLSSGPMLIIRRGAVIPADGKWEVTARKVWWATEEADQGRSMADVFTSVNIPTMQAELNGIMDRAYKMMEDATGISFLLQGQQGSAPDTVGGMELLHRNASALLRRIARVFDERVTEPHIRRYYEWLLLHGPDEAKGDMSIEAIGSTALVEREIQAMEAMQLLQLSLNPAFGLDPAKAMTEVLKVKRFIPEKWERDPNTQPPAPVVPAIEVAKIRSQDEQARLALEKDKIIAANTLAKHKVDVDTDRDRIYVESQAQRDQTLAQQRAQELAIKRELALVDYANKRNIALDQVKAELAREAMKLKVQKDLSRADAAMAQVAEPAFEPPGKAEPGHAFTQ